MKEVKGLYCTVDNEKNDMVLRDANFKEICKIKAEGGQVFSGGYRG